MRGLLLAVGLIVGALPSVAGAAESLSAEDAGVYEMLRLDDGEMAENRVRFNLVDAEWQFFSKYPGKPWERIRFTKQTDFKPASKASLKKFFTAKTLKNNDITCITNKALVFCRLVPEGEMAKVSHLMIDVNSGDNIMLILNKIADVDK